MEQPRPYQFVLFQRAQKENTIVVMETGTGKTMIALLLLKYCQSQNPKKVSFFLVPTVPLVHQQQLYLSTNSKLKVKGISGETSEEQRVNQKYQVFVMTPQIFLQSLDHGYVSMDKINVIVFDECHHCRGNHPYNLIMSMHYHKRDVGKRPLIFGMTASPQSASGDTEDEIRQLELNLSSKTVTCQSLGLNQHTKNPTERIIYYEPLDFHETPKLYLKVAQEKPILFHYAEKFIREALHFSDLLGPWCGERLLEAGLLEVKRKCRQIIRDRMIEIIENDVIANAECDLDVYVKEYWENRDNCEYFSDGEESDKDDKVPKRLEPDEIENEDVMNLDSVESRIDDVEEGECDPEYFDVAFGEDGEIVEDLESSMMNLDSMAPITNNMISDILSNMEFDHQGNVVSFVNAKNEDAPRLKRKKVQSLMDQVVEEIKMEMAPDDLEFVFKQEKKHILDELSTPELEDIESFILKSQEVEGWGPKSSPPQSSELSAKLQVLVDTLLEFESDSQFCGIIFCQMKSVTIAIQSMIEKHPKLKFIKSAYLIGHNPYLKSRAGMAVDIQASIVKKFSAGKLNLLVATRVAEEGLDIKPCNCVIQFDFLEKTVSSYIQSRGRARHLTSQYIILAKQGDGSVHKLLESKNLN